MKHKHLTFLLSVLMSMVASVASAHDFEVDGIYYKITSSSSPYTVAVTYRGSDDHHSYSDRYTGRVTIPESVTYNSTTYSVTSIDGFAFRFCSDLTSISISESVTSIGYSAFSGCSGLTSVTIPSSVTSIGQYAFSGCSALNSIVVESGNAMYDSRDNCNAIIATATNTLIAGCMNTTIPESVINIGFGAFSNCSGLTSITIPNSVTSIGSYAFYGCTGLTSITFGSSVTNIGESAFYECRGLTSIVVEIGNTKYDSRDNCNAIIETATNTLIAGCKNTIIPNSVTSIGESAFENCSGLTSITIPNSVTSIGRSAFGNCTGLTKAEFASIESLCGIFFEDYEANPLHYAHHLYIEGSEVTDLVIPESVTSIYPYAFSGCTGLTSATISESVTYISYNAFSECSGISSVTIGNNVFYIDNSAFSGCSGVTSITIPNSVTSIGDYGFSGCSGLSTVTIGNSVTSIGECAFSHCSVLASFVVGSGNTTYDSRDNCNAIIETATNTLIAGCKNTIIPNSVTSIGEWAFSDCSGLTSVTIGNSVTSIGEYAFCGCSGLTSVTIGNSVTSIGNYVFGGCSSLTSVTIGNSVNSIGDSAFNIYSSALTTIIVESGNTTYDSRDNCNAIIETATNMLIQGCKNTIIPSSVTCIGECAFDYCSDLTSISIPNSVTSIGDFAFEYCFGLTSIFIPNSVTSIGYGAFSGCRALTSVSIPNSVTSIGHAAFSSCGGLTSVTVAWETPLSLPINSNPFYHSNASNATLYVPRGSKAAYEAANYWKDFKEIVEYGGNVHVADGETFTNDMEQDVDELTYTRNFTNTEWQALYVPFEMQYEDWSADFEVARLNNVHQYDDNKDGEVDRTILEAFLLTNGCTTANTPYLIRAKTIGEKTVALQDATLYASEENSIDCASVDSRYTFTGTYTGVTGGDMVENGYYTLNAGSLRQAEGDAEALSPMRWYMRVTDRNGNPKGIGEVKLMVFGEDDQTGLNNLTPTLSGGEGDTYDLTGRKISHSLNSSFSHSLPKGVYVRNGKKFVVK